MYFCFDENGEQGAYEIPLSRSTMDMGRGIRRTRLNQVPQNRALFVHGERERVESCTTGCPPSKRNISVCSNEEQVSNACKPSMFWEVNLIIVDVCNKDKSDLKSE